jgi:hypothetical protein
MRHVTYGRLGGPAAQLRQVATVETQKTELPFATLLDQQDVEQTLAAHDVQWRQGVFTPLVTVQAFLSQVLDGDASCVATVARVLAWRLGAGRAACSANSGGYCQARQRLSEAALHALGQHVGQRLHEPPRVVSDGLLNGRTIKLVDGSTVSMPDTPANQNVYPQAGTQQPGLGFPIARLLALISLHSGALLDLAVGPYLGKQTGENALLRGLFDQLQPGDIVAGDCGFGSFWNFAMLQARGVDALFPLHQCRPEDFRQGQRLGKDDRLVQWRKPRQRPDWMSQARYQSLPETLTLRQVRVRLAVPGFRVRTLVLVTTLIDPQKYPKEELAEVYHRRWHAELDLRSIKSALHLDVLRCKTPAMVRKEIWMHLLAYNLIRTVMAQAAATAGCPPRQLSFCGAWQTLHAFAPLTPWRAGDPHLYAAMLQAVASHRVGHRPNRVEPRAVKRRPKPHALLTEPRQQARNHLYRGPQELR